MNFRNRVFTTLILFLMMSFVTISLQNNAYAVAQWSRKYKTSCTTCHTSFPRLNYYGERFMKNYDAVRMELSARDIGRSSILSLGACVVGNSDEQFYRELKPLSYFYDRPCMSIATPGLQCIPEKLRSNPFYDPNHRDFRPDLILRLLYKHGTEPRQVMHDFSNWVSVVGGDNPIMLAKPISVDGRIIKRYFDLFLENSRPFGDSGFEDLVETYHRVMNNDHVRFKDLGVMNTRLCEHNALEDAIYQSLQYQKIQEIQTQSQGIRVQ